MRYEIEKLEKKAKLEFANITNEQELLQWKKNYSSKNSQLKKIMQNMINLNESEKIVIGKLVNILKDELKDLFDSKLTEIQKLQLFKQQSKEKVDITLPGNDFILGNYHPLSIILNDMKMIFQNLGYEIISGTEIETDEYNFERLNLAKDHPVREMQDSLYINNNHLLRTHCTNVTARFLENWDGKQTKSIISLGNVYRRDDDDATHSHQFMQFEGFLLGPNVNFSNLKWTLQYFLKTLFGENIKMQLRPSYFPFTEPSVEVDISCINCLQKGCSICKRTGWVEVLGAGMIAPEVFDKANKNLHQPQGFAFGIGVERIAMLKYKIDDIRRFYTNDLRFLKQFN